jgi:hypothetical protein
VSRSPHVLALAAALAIFAAGAAGAAPTQPAAPRAGGSELFPATPVIYDMETLRTGPLPQEFLKTLEPLHTLQAVEDLLKANRIAFAWSRAQVSSGTLPASFVNQLDALPPREVFVMPGPDGALIGVIIGRK